MSQDCADGRKRCRSCHGDMSLNDLHSDCLKCLSVTHISTTCLVCREIPFSIISFRLGFVDDAILNCRWDPTWREKLAQTENAVWSEPRQNSPSLSADEVEVTGDKSSNTLAKEPPKD